MLLEGKKKVFITTSLVSAYMPLNVSVATYLFFNKLNKTMLPFLGKSIFDKLNSLKSPFIVFTVRSKKPFSLFLGEFFPDFSRERGKNGRKLAARHKGIFKSILEVPLHFW
jgi:hypothetical protein